MIKQVFLIHGGDPSESYEAYLKLLKNYPINLERHGLRKNNYQDILPERLGNNFQVIRPEMPNKRAAKYNEWKIWFEKFFQFLEDDVILVGNSLGATFLAKYLSENTFPKKIKALFLVAGASADNLPEYKMLDFALPENMDRLTQQVETAFLYHSTDDNVVPISNLDKFKQVLPNAVVRIFNDRGHFNKEEFPELTSDIKNL